MSTTTEKEIDYQAYMRENPSDMPNIIRGPEAREKRREAAWDGYCEKSGMRAIHGSLLRKELVE